MFRLNLYFPLLLALLSASFITLFSVIYIQENTIHKSKEKVSSQYARFLNQKIDYDVAVLSEYINFIQTQNNLAADFKKGDKKQIYDSVKGIYDRLNRNIELTHMYFIKTDGTVLLRVHDYSRDHDTIDRATFLKAKETQALVYGLEFGINKNYTLRIIKPWYEDGKLIGYIELGKEIDRIIDEYTHLLETNVYLAVKKEIYQNSSGIIESNIKQKSASGNYYIVYHTYDVPPQMESILEDSIDQKDIEFKERQYYVTKMKLSDFSKKDLGYFVFLQDVTMEHRVMYGAIKALFALLAVLAIIFFITGFMLIRKKENNINTLTSELKKQKEELLLFNNKLQKLFDLQKNIVILTDGKSLMMANRTMLDFFGFKNLGAFLEHYNCICERFVEDDRFFHLGKVPENKNWVEILKDFSPEKRIVALLDQEEKTHIFSVSINEFDTYSYIISFADISNTVRDQIKLIQKVTHDQLTGAFNREFLENNIDYIISDVEPKKLGVIMCDIDYFKRVNDTYGHNRGDEVLKQFVNITQKSIRDEDYLIRWGGEEFVILMKVDSLQTLHKISENIRMSIQNTPFEEIQTITASFGATLHQKEETIFTSIARADKALYMAKANGRNRVEIF